MREKLAIIIVKNRNRSTNVSDKDCSSLYSLGIYFYVLWTTFLSFVMDIFLCIMDDVSVVRDGYIFMYYGRRNDGPTERRPVGMTARRNGYKNNLRVIIIRMV
jgi:hypothetical protein